MTPVCGNGEIGTTRETNSNCREFRNILQSPEQQRLLKCATKIIKHDV